MLDSFHVPLIDQNHNTLTLRLINFLEQILVTFIDEDPLEFREVNISGLDEPVDVICV